MSLLINLTPAEEAQLSAAAGHQRDPRGAWYETTLMTTPTKAEVKEFVEAAHGDLPKLQRMLAEKPDLLLLPNGNETALGAACQMRCPDIIKFLLGHGETMDLSAACVLGLTDKVAAFLDADPILLSRGNKKAHKKHPLYFAAGQPQVLALLKARGAK